MRTLSAAIALLLTTGACVTDEAPELEDLALDEAMLLGGSDPVQELQVNPATRPFPVAPTPVRSLRIDDPRHLGAKNCGACHSDGD